MPLIYLDNAASTPPAPEVLEALTQTARQAFANPSSAHRLGAAGARLLEQARAQVASLLRAEPEEIVFTSGGTEADALGLLGAAEVARGRHLVVSAIEHPAVLRNAERLKARGFELTLVAPDKTGVVSPAAVAAAVRPDTAVVAVMLANNELGTVQPLAEIARAILARSLRPHLHVDAVQAAGFTTVDVRTLGADTLAISGHKFHGPKGAGALWVRKGARLGPLWDGGRQERGLRSGTENLPGCVALGRAATLCGREATARVQGLRDQLEERLRAAVPEGSPTVTNALRVPHIASFTIPDLPAEPVLHALEARDVFVAAGSACASKTRGPSHVLKAIGVDDRAAVLRFSLSRLTTEAELAAAVVAFAAAVAEVRAVA